MEKIKLIIVDDELTSRNLLKGFLQNEAIYEVVEDFRTGQHALEWLRHHSVDIVLCDMQMPEMSGVEFMRSIHIIKEYLPVIVISGFDDFNYVRGSLINGAANYLLKHELTKEHLLEVLDQVREKYKITSQSSGSYHKRGHCIYDITEFSAPSITQLVQSGEIEFSVNNVMTVAISPDYKTIPETNILEYRSDICKAVIDIINQILGSHHNYLIYVTPKQHLLLLISFAHTHSTSEIMSIVNNLARRIQRQTVRMLDTTITLITGEIHSTVDGAIQQALQLDGMLADKLYLGGNRLEYSVVTRKLVYSPAQIDINMLKQLEFELSHGMPDCIETIHEIVEHIQQTRYPHAVVIELCRKILGLFVATGMIDDVNAQQMQLRFKSYEEFDQYRTELLGLTNQAIQRMEGQRQYSQQISSVVDYIRKNYANDISLESCAEIIHCSYTYLSREFKKETGLRFVAFLNLQRVNKAKSLLIRHQLSMKVIGEAAGFRNYNYFFKVFKEVEGTTPTEYLAKKWSDT